MKIIIYFAVAAVLFGILLTNVSAQSKLKADDLKNLAGNWEGELEYLDYQNDKSKVKLKLRSVNKVENAKVAFDITYIEPNGKEVKGGGEFSVSDNGLQIIDDQRQWKIVKNSFDKKTKTRTIVYESKGQDNDRNADFRESLIVGKDEFTTIKEVRYENTTDFFVRNTRRFTRKN